MRPKKLIVLCCVLASAVAALAQDGSMLKPPAGATVAIVVFEDMECPSCAQRAPLLDQAAKTYSVPLVIHDFPLRQHPWAFDASVYARFFEEKYGKPVSDAFRLFIYQFQPQVTKDNLRSYAERFASDKKLELPFMLDPQGKLAAAIRADSDFGTNVVKINETPTTFVVTSKGSQHVTDYAQLYTMVDQAKRANPAPAPAPAKASPKKAPARKKSGQ
jgi:protein-disulfide isomerase